MANAVLLGREPFVHDLQEDVVEESLNLSGNVIEDVRRQFESDWLACVPRPLIEYLPTENDAGYVPTLVELICIDLEFRWRRTDRRPEGSSPQLRVEDYLREFPVLDRAPLVRRLVRAEWMIRVASGEHPTIVEVRQRFPQLAIFADTELFPEGVDVDSPGHPAQETWRRGDEVKTASFVPATPPDEVDPTLTYCVRRGAEVVPNPVPAFGLAEFSFGMVLAGRYQLDHELGRGGMGRVFLARDTRLDRPVAIKVMLAPAASRSAADNQRWERMFEEEARLGAGLLHPAIATVFDYGLQDGLPYTVFEYIRGNSLRELIRQRAPLSLDEVRRILAPLAQGLDFAHQRRVVHRDLKPENIRGTEDEQFKILDLGLAKRFDLAENDWRFSGTPAYAAPEQAAEQPSDGRVDQYALGTIVFELLTGQRPFFAKSPWEYLEMHQRAPAPSPATVVPGLPPAVSAAILRTLAKDPHDRFGSCEEFATALGCRLMSHATTVPTTRLEQSVRVSRSSFSLGWSQEVRGAYVALLPDALWIYHRGEIQRRPLNQLDEVGRSADGRSLHIHWKRESALPMQQWRFPNAAICSQWSRELQTAARQVRQNRHDWDLVPFRPPVMLVRGRPNVLLQMLGQLEARAPSRWEAVACLSLRAAIAGADAVVDLSGERLFGPQHAEHRLTGKPVKVAGEQGIVELATRWSASRIARLAISAGWLAAIIAAIMGGLATLPSLIRMVAGDFQGIPGMILDLGSEFTRSTGSLLLCALAWPGLLLLLLAGTKWPQGIHIAGHAIRWLAISPLAGKLVAIALFGLAPRDWYGQLRLLAEMGVLLLFAGWFWELAGRLIAFGAQLDRLFAKRRPTPVRRLGVRALYAVTAVHAAITLALSTWLGLSTLRNSGSAHLLALSINQRLRPLQQELQQRALPANPTEGKLSLLNDLTEQSRGRNANRPTENSEAVSRIAAMATDDDPQVRVAACRVLGDLRARSTEAAEALIGRLGDSVPDVRRTAFRTLQMLHQSQRGAISPDLASALFRYLQVCDRTEWSEVTSLLQKVDSEWTGRPEAFDFAEQLGRELRAGDPTVRADAANFLAALGAAAQAELPKLAACLGDVDYNIRGSARRALDVLDPGWQRSDVGNLAAEALVAQLGSQVWPERYAAAEMLGQLNLDWSGSAAARAAVPAIIESLGTAKQGQFHAFQTILDQIDADWRKSQDCAGTVAVLVDRLQSGDGDERVAAVAGLRVLGQAAVNARAPLIDRVLHDEESSRNYALEALESVDPNWSQSPEFTERLPAVGENLHHPQSSRRLSAVRLLAKVAPGSDLVVDLLAGRLSDPDPTLRRAVRETLEKQTHPTTKTRLLQVLIPAFLGEPPTQSADELAHLATILKRIDNSWQQHSAADEIREQAASRLRSDRPEDRYRALALLPLLGTPAERLTPLLIPLLIDGDRQTRSAAQSALQRTDPGWSTSQEFFELVPHIVKQLDDENLELRLSAIRLLASAGPPPQTGSSVLDQWQSWLARNAPQTVETVGALVRQLDDPEPRVREAALTTLGKLRYLAAPATATVAARLSDPVPGVRYAARMALPQLRNDWRSAPELAPVVSSFVEQLDEASAEARDRALDALAFVGPAAAPAVERLATLLEDTDPRIQAKAVETLGSLGRAAEAALPSLAKKRSVPAQRYAVESAMTRIRPDWRQTVPQPELVQSLRESLRNSPAQRWDALSQLRSLGENARPALGDIAALVADPDARVRHAALEALDAIDPQWRDSPVGDQAREILVRSLSSTDDRVRMSSILALGRFGRRAAGARDPLLALVHHSDPSLREAAIQLISEVCQPESEVITSLIGLLRHASPATRASALKSVSKLDPSWYQRPEGEKWMVAWRSELKGAKPTARWEALEQVRRIETPPASMVQDVAAIVHDRDLQVRLTAISTLQAWGREARLASAQLLIALEDPAAHVRTVGAAALEQVDPDWRRLAAATDLEARAMRRLRDGDAESRRLGVEILARCTEGSDPRRAELLLPSLADHDAQVHAAVANFLRPSKPRWIRSDQVKALVKQWREQLRAASPEARSVAAMALAEAEIASRDALGDLIAATADEAPTVRAAAVNALVRLKEELRESPAAHDALIRRIVDPATTQLARQSLDSVWPEWRNSPAAQLEVKSLTDQLSSDEETQRQAAIMALAAFGQTARPAIAPLLKLSIEPSHQALALSSLTSIDSAWRDAEETREGIEWLAKAIESSDATRRVAVAQALGRTNERAISTLMACLQDSDLRVRIAAIQGLANLGAEQALPAIREQRLLPGAKQAAESAIRQIESKKRARK